MAFQITFKPSDKTIFVEADDTILSAALQQGVNIPYGCRNGACGACKAQLIHGEVHYDDEVMGLSKEEKNQSYALLCCAKPDSDITLACHELASQAGLLPKIFPVRVEQLTRVGRDVMVMTLKLPMNQSMHFYAGQYIEFILKDGSRRAFSLANPSHRNDSLELHLRHVPGGKFTDYVFNELSEKTILRIEGPFGQFYWREELQRPVIFVAGGTGFAPIKGLIEDLIVKYAYTQAVTLYWGMKTAEDFYMLDEIQSWQQKLQHFNFIPVLSEQTDLDKWQGRTGYVHQAILEDIADFSAYQVYCCGSPAMVDACQQAFQERGLAREHFFADIFSYAAK